MVKPKYSKQANRTKPQKFWIETKHRVYFANSETTPTGTKMTLTRKNTETTYVTQSKTSVSCSNMRFLSSRSSSIIISRTSKLTHFGVRIGLQAGSSCCVNLESAQKNLGVRIGSQARNMSHTTRLAIPLNQHFDLKGSLMPIAHTQANNAIMYRLDWRFFWIKLGIITR